MNPNVIAMGGTLIVLSFVSLLVFSPSRRRRSLRTQEIRVNTAMGLDIQTSIPKRGDFDAIIKFNAMTHSLLQHNITPEQIGFVDMKHLASAAAKAYKKAIDGAKQGDSEYKYKQVMFEALRQFCRQQHIDIPTV